MNTSTTFLGTFLVLILLINSSTSFGSSKSGYCPLRKTVTSCTPRCMSDFDCGGDRKCCPNACDSTSCAETSSVQVSEGKYDGGYSSVAICDNVKCQPKQICKTDKRTKRQYCTYY